MTGLSCAIANTQQTPLFVVCLTSGTRQTADPGTVVVQPLSLPCASTGTRQIKIQDVCFMSLLCALSQAHGKMFKKILIHHSKLFLLSTYYTCYYMLSFGIFIGSFAIFNQFILVNEFLVDKSNLNCKCSESLNIMSRKLTFTLDHSSGHT